MHLLIVRLESGEVQYFGPFPTYFRANEYGLACRTHIRGYVGHQVVKMILPHTMRVSFK